MGKFLHFMEKHRIMDVFLGVECAYPHCNIFSRATITSVLSYPKLFVGIVLQYFDVGNFH